MKKFFVVVVLVVAAIFAKAQEPLFVKGDKVINLGVGFNSYPVVSISGEMGFMDGIADKGTVGFGAYVGLGKTLTSSYYLNRTVISGGLRGTFHYPFIEKLDTYAGLGLGIRYDNYKNNDILWSYDDGVHPQMGLFIGGRYPVTEKINVFGELGFGASYLTAGVAFKL